MSHGSRSPIAAAGVVALVAAILAGLVPSPAAQAAQEVQLVPVDALEQPIVRQVRALRVAADLARIQRSQELTDAAERHAAALARSGTFTHQAPGEKPFTARLQASYSSRGFVRWATGENMFWAQTHVSPAQVVRAWLASPPHRANMYDPLWRDVGVAAVRAPSAPGVYGGRDVTIVVIEFGTRRR